MVEIKWEIDDKDLIKVLIEEYDFEAKNYIDAQLLIFFEQHKNEIEKKVGEYIQSKEFKEKLLGKINEHLNNIANSELF